MNKFRTFYTLPAFLVPILLIGCATPGDRSAYRDPSEVERRFQTQRVDPNDYNIVVTRMVESLLNREFLRVRGGERPMVALGNVFNNTPYNVRTELLVNKITVEMTKPGSPIRFSAATSEARRGGQSGSLYRQLEFQNESGHVDPATISRTGRQIGANYVLYGFVESIETRARGATQAYFSFILKLHSVETGEIIWAEEAEITKVL